jgi:hypothetical protein
LCRPSGTRLINLILPGTDVPGYRLLRPYGTVSVAVLNPLAQPGRIALPPCPLNSTVPCPLNSTVTISRLCLSKSTGPKVTRVWCARWQRDEMGGKPGFVGAPLLWEATAGGLVVSLALWERRLTTSHKYGSLKG